METAMASQISENNYSIIRVVLELAKKKIESFDVGVLEKRLIMLFKDFPDVEISKQSIIQCFWKTTNNRKHFVNQLARKIFALDSIDQNRQIKIQFSSLINCIEIYKLDKTKVSEQIIYYWLLVADQIL